MFQSTSPAAPTSSSATTAAACPMCGAATMTMIVAIGRMSLPTATTRRASRATSSATSPAAAFLKPGSVMGTETAGRETTLMRIKMNAVSYASFCLGQTCICVV